MLESYPSIDNILVDDSEEKYEKYWGDADTEHMSEYYSDYECKVAAVEDSSLNSKPMLVNPNTNTMIIETKDNSLLFLKNDKSIITDNIGLRRNLEKSPDLGKWLFECDLTGDGYQELILNPGGSDSFEHNSEIVVIDQNLMEQIPVIDDSEIDYESYLSEMMIDSKTEEVNLHITDKLGNRYDYSYEDSASDKIAAYKITINGSYHRYIYVHNNRIYFAHSIEVEYVKSKLHHNLNAVIAVPLSYINGEFVPTHEYEIIQNFDINTMRF